MDMSEEEQPGKIRHHKKQINRKTKLHLVFDPEARKEFLTGFHKRKVQRKKKAQRELEEQLKIERKRLKLEAKETYKKLCGVHRPIPGLEDLASEKYELENHSVSIVELSAADLAERNSWIGPNRVQYEEENSTTEKDEKKEQNDELPGMELKTTHDVKKVLKKKATKEVKKSKAFQLKNKLESQKNRQKSRKQKNQKMKMRFKQGKQKGKKRNT